VRDIVREQTAKSRRGPPIQELWAGLVVQSGSSAVYFLQELGMELMLETMLKIHGEKGLRRVAGAIASTMHTHSGTGRILVQYRSPTSVMQALDYLCSESKAGRGRSM